MTETEKKLIGIIDALIETLIVSDKSESGMVFCIQDRDALKDIQSELAKIKNGNTQ